MDIGPAVSLLRYAKGDRAFPDYALVQAADTQAHISLRG